jgi:hypothetical protein
VKVGQIHVRHPHRRPAARKKRFRRHTAGRRY